MNVYRTRLAKFAIHVVVLMLCSGTAGEAQTPSKARTPSGEATKYQWFQRNLRTIASQAKNEKDLAKEVATKLQDGPADKDFEKRDEYLAKMAALLASISKVLPGLSGAIVTGVGVLLVPDKTALEISDALNFARKLTIDDRQKIVVWTMWNTNPDGFVKLLSNPEYPDRILLVLAGRV